MLLAVAALFLGTRSVLFFLHGIGAAKVIRVLAPPLLIGLPSAAGDTPVGHRSFAVA